jgi:hypothetical protein
MLIQVGENEIPYDNATRVRDAGIAAGVDVAFEAWRHGIHVWPVLSLPGCPNPLPPSNSWQPFSRAKPRPDKTVRGAVLAALSTTPVISCAPPHRSGQVVVPADIVA